MDTPSTLLGTAALEVLGAENPEKPNIPPDFSAFLATGAGEGAGTGVGLAAGLATSVLPLGLSSFTGREFRKPKKPPPEGEGAFWRVEQDVCVCMEGRLVGELVGEDKRTMQKSDGHARATT